MGAARALAALRTAEAGLAGKMKGSLQSAWSSTPRPANERGLGDSGLWWPRGRWPG